jgi:hypothetical protein
MTPNCVPKPMPDQRWDIGRGEAVADQILFTRHRSLDRVDDMLEAAVIHHFFALPRHCEPHRVVGPRHLEPARDKNSRPMWARADLTWQLCRVLYSTKRINNWRTL